MRFVTKRPRDEPHGSVSLDRSIVSASATHVYFALTRDRALNVTCLAGARPPRLQRVMQSPIARIIVAAIFLVATMLVLQAISAETHFTADTVPKALFAVVTTVIALIAAYSGYVHLIERRSVLELAPGSAFPEFSIGFVVGGLLFCAIMLILWISGVAAIAKGAGWSVVALPLLSAFELAVMQAIFVCGIVFRIAEGSLGTWVALTLTMVVFGALHAGSPGANVISEAAIGLEAGSLLAALYVYSRTLWMPIGLLTAWDFMESGIFGVSVAGHSESGLLASRFHGADILTGGKPGPEVSIVAVLVCVLVAVLALVAASRRGRIVPPYWRRKPRSEK